MVFPIFERWGLNPREQRIATVALVLAGVVAVLLVPLGFGNIVARRAAENDELRAAIETINGARAAIHERQERKATIAQRYAQRAPQLAGYIEQTATEQKLQVTDSIDRPEAPIGKRYAERNTVVHLKKSGMLAIANFLESLENSGFPLSVTRLNIRTRSGEANSYDVEVGVSAFDRNDGEKDKK